MRREDRLVLAPPERRRGAGAAAGTGMGLAVDACLLAASLFVILLVTFFGPDYARGDVGRAAFALALVRPLVDLAALAVVLREVLRRNRIADGTVYLQVTRGVAKRDHAFPKDVAPTVFLMSNPLVNPPRELVEKGVGALSAVDNRWLRCDIKSISLIGNCLLRQISADAGAAETVMFRDGRLTEASASNVFIVKGGVIRSPAKSNLILPGITYGVVVELAQSAGIALEFGEVAEAEVRAADEVWVTSSSKEVLAIVELDGKPIGDGKPGAVFRRMYQLYQEFKQRVMRAGKQAVAA